MRNSWAAHQINTTVAWFGTVIENALDERVNKGTEQKPDWQDKYTLEQILAPDFRLPIERMLGMTTGTGFVENGAAMVLAMATEQRGLVKQYRYIGPEPGVAS